MAVKNSIKVVTKGNVSTELVNSIHRDMIYNHDEYFNKVTVRAKSVIVTLKMHMDADVVDELEEKYQSWYDAENLLNGVA